MMIQNEMARDKCLSTTGSFANDVNSTSKVEDAVVSGVSPIHVDRCLHSSYWHFHLHEEDEYKGSDEYSSSEAGRESTTLAFTISLALHVNDGEYCLAAGRTLTTLQNPRLVKCKVTSM